MVLEQTAPMTIKYLSQSVHELVLLFLRVSFVDIQWQISLMLAYQRCCAATSLLQATQHSYCRRRPGMHSFFLDQTRLKLIPFHALPHISSCFMQWLLPSSFSGPFFENKVDRHSSRMRRCEKRSSLAGATTWSLRWRPWHLLKL